MLFADSTFGLRCLRPFCSRFVTASLSIARMLLQKAERQKPVLHDVGPRPPRRRLEQIEKFKCNSSSHAIAMPFRSRPCDGGYSKRRVQPRRHALLPAGGKATVRGAGAGRHPASRERGDFAAPRSVNPQVDPALESICLNALAVSPTGRYPSARAMAIDLEHWLADEPVSTYGEPFSVRLRRWARRHRTAVTIGAGVLQTTVVVLAVSTWLLSQSQARIERQRRIAVAARDTALTEREAANTRLSVPKRSIRSSSKICSNRQTPSSEEEAARCRSAKR